MRFLSVLMHRDTHWLGFFGLVLAAWAGLFFSASDGLHTNVLPQQSVTGLTALGQQFIALCQASPETSHFGALLGMWVTMSIAMMAPTLFPALRTYDDFIHGGAATSRGFVALLAGYIAVWLGFSVLAASGQTWLAAGMTAADTRAPEWGLWINGVLFLVAGFYQFSTYKAACLRQCQQPLTFFMQRWQAGTLGSLRMGIALGGVCLGCCWALMSLALVSGAMSLAWMGLATLLMVVEKLPAVSPYISRPLGVTLLIGGAIFIGRALALS